MDLRTLYPEVVEGLELQRLSLIKSAEMIGPEGAFARIALQIAEPLQSAIMTESMRGTHPYSMVEATGRIVGYIAATTCVQFAQQAEDKDAFCAAATSGMMNFALEHASVMFERMRRGSMPGIAIEVRESGPVIVTALDAGTD